MSDPIERYKDQADWTVEEIVQNRAHGTVPENPEYVEKRREVLVRAGLEDEDSPDTRDRSEWTVDDHLKRQRKGMRP